MMVLDAGLDLNKIWGSRQGYILECANLTFFSIFVGEDSVLSKCSKLGQIQFGNKFHPFFSIFFSFKIHVG